MLPMDAALKERASRIRMLILDVDGVLTDGNFTSTMPAMR